MKKLVITSHKGKKTTLTEEKFCWQFEAGLLWLWKAGEDGTKRRGVPVAKFKHVDFEEVESE